MRVKICGIQTLDEAMAVIDAGADALGFHVELEHAKNPIGSATLNAIISRLPPFVSTVVVTTETDPKKLSRIARATGANTLQLHGDIEPDAVRAVKALMFYLKIYVAVHAGSDAYEKAKSFGDSADAILLDSPKSETGARGGSGKTHDWTASREIVDSLSLPVILAGGLNPENIADAIRAVQPYAVDVNSGVSNPDGTKDLERVRLFIEAAKSA